MAEASKISIKIGISLKQRIREAVWSTFKDRETNPKLACDEAVNRKLQLHYRDNYIDRDNGGYPMYVYVRNKAAIEVLTSNDEDKIKTYMKKLKLPGAQVTFNKGKNPTVEWFCWYEGYIFTDEDNETITSDPYDNRSFEIDEDSKIYLKRTILTALSTRENTRSSTKDIVYKSLKETYKSTYKERYIDDDLMPYITILDFCVMDIINRNRGLVMNSDVKLMKKYMHELLIPGALINFTKGVLTTIAWFSCKESKLEMEIEILQEIPSETLHLHLDNKIKTVIREIVITLQNNKIIQSANEHKDEIVHKLKEFWPNTFKDKFQNGHMPDITIESECIIDTRHRNRGIVMTQDRNTMKDSMIDLNMPAVQINFIDGNSAVVLWFTCKNKNMYIELEALGEDIKGDSLADFLKV